MPLRSMVLLTVSLTSALVACDKDPAPSGGSTAAPSATPSISAVAASASATVSAAPTHPHAGTWKGTFEATKGDVTVDEGVPYQTWKKETGKELAGDGKLELTVRPNGSVSGEATGALGKLRAMGVLQPDGELAVTLQPDDPNAEDAMTGTLVGTVKEGVLEAVLRASSRDGDRVRKASITLKKLR